MDCSREVSPTQPPSSQHIQPTITSDRHLTPLPPQARSTLRSVFLVGFSHLLPSQRNRADALAIGDVSSHCVDI